MGGASKKKLSEWGNPELTGEIWYIFAYIYTYMYTCNWLYFWKEEHSPYNHKGFINNKLLGSSRINLGSKNRIDTWWVSEDRKRKPNAGIGKREVREEIWLRTAKFKDHL